MAKNKPVVEVGGVQTPLPLPPDPELVEIRHFYCEPRGRVILPSEDDIHQMAAVLEQDGQMRNPIMAIKVIGYVGPDGMVWDPPAWRLDVIDGVTRASAADQLGWTHIPARVYPAGSLTEDQRGYLEVRENLTRRNLTQLLRFTLLLEEMERGINSGIYKPHGGDRGNQYTGGKPDNRPSWQDVVEPQHGVSVTLCEKWFATIRRLKNDTSLFGGGVQVLRMIRETWPEHFQSRATLDRIAQLSQEANERSADVKQRLASFKRIETALERIGQRSEDEIDPAIEEIIGKVISRTRAGPLALKNRRKPVRQPARIARARKSPEPAAQRQAQPSEQPAEPKQTPAPVAEELEIPSSEQSSKDSQTETNISPSDSADVVALESRRPSHRQKLIDALTAAIRAVEADIGESMVFDVLREYYPERAITIAFKNNYVTS